MRRILFLFAVLLVLSATPVYAQEEVQPDVVLQVIVLYDQDGDGQREGVGEGVVVNVRELSKEQGVIHFTDKFSSAFFDVPTGLHRIRAFPPSRRLLYMWVCDETVFVSDTNDTVTLECELKFFMRFPWTRK